MEELFLELLKGSSLTHPWLAFAQDGEGGELPLLDVHFHHLANLKSSISSHRKAIRIQRRERRPQVVGPTLGNVQLVVPVYIPSLELLATFRRVGSPEKVLVRV